MSFAEWFRVKSLPVTRAYVESLVKLLLNEIRFSREYIMTGFEHLGKAAADTAVAIKALAEAQAKDFTIVKADVQMLVDKAKDGAAAAELDKIADGIAGQLDGMTAGINQAAAESDKLAAAVDLVVNPPAATTPPVVVPPVATPPADTPPA